MKMHLQTELASEFSYHNGDMEKVQISAEAEMLYYELIQALEEEEMVFRDHLAGILKHMETLIRSNESRKFYQEVRTAKKAYQPATQLLEDEEGNLVSDPEKQKTMWRQYFQQLLNSPPVTNENLVNTEDCRVDHDPHKEPPDFEEVRRAIMRLKNHKSPGIDNIAGELWKYGGGAMQSRLYELIRRIWEEEQQPIE